MRDWYGSHSGEWLTMLGKDADKKAEAFASVEQHVTESYPRTYIWCSDDDDVVPADNTRNMVVALQKAGVPVKSMICHGVPHGAGPGTGTTVENWLNEAVDFWLER